MLVIQCLIVYLVIQVFTCFEYVIVCTIVQCVVFAYLLFLKRHVFVVSVMFDFNNMNIAYIGSKVRVLALCLNKQLTSLISLRCHCIRASVPYKCIYVCRVNMGTVCIYGQKGVRWIVLPVWLPENAGNPSQGSLTTNPIYPYTLNVATQQLNVCTKIN